MFAKSLIKIDLLRSWIMDAGKIALSQAAYRQVEFKADLTPVTQIDHQVETFLAERILKHYPGHGILAEEGSSQPGSEFTWIIDPIDGTRAFSSGLPVWGISVGVFHQGKPHCGVFYMPATKETYWASEGEAYLNKRPLLPVSAVDLHAPLAFIAVPSNAHQHFEIAYPRLRSLGSTTAHLAYVAYGIAAAAITRRIKIWDLAAVLPALRISQTELIYLSGKTFEPKDIINGEPAAEPIIVAHQSIMEDVHACVTKKV